MKRKGLIDLFTLEVLGVSLLLVALVIGALYLWNPGIFHQALGNLNKFVKGFRFPW